METQRDHYLLILLLPLLASACAGCVYEHLHSEMDVPEFKAMKAMADARPQRTVRVPVRLAGGRTIRIALHESGPADADRVIVMIHGVLSNGEMWRFVRGDLSADHRLIVVDLPGSGHSDAPEPRDLGPDGYAPATLCHVVLEALSQRLAQTPPAEHITLVGHSLGGLLVVRMLGNEQLRARHANVLDRVDGSVLFTPIDVAVEKEPAAFRAIVDVTDMQVAIAVASGLLRQKVAEGIVSGVSDPADATREEADRVYRILATASTRHAHQSMLLHAVPWSNGRPIWWGIERLVRCYDRVQPPCLIVWGARDELFSQSMGYKLVQQIPQARLRIVPRGMHSLPTECPSTCAVLIRQFLAGIDQSPQIALVADNASGSAAGW